MDNIFLKFPTMEDKQEWLDYVADFKEDNPEATPGGFKDNTIYEDWLEKLNNEHNNINLEEGRVPASFYFLMNGNRILGSISIRHNLDNEMLSKFGGHIGYGIRPTERGKGYNKINLYLGLKICKEHGIKEVFMDADKENPASWKTMESLGGINIREYYDDEYAHCVVKDYTINVDNAIEENRKKYEHLLSDNIITKKL